jgi:hypothetical protein
MENQSYITYLVLSIFVEINVKYFYSIVFRVVRLDKNNDWNDSHYYSTTNTTTPTITTTTEAAEAELLYKMVFRSESLLAFVVAVFLIVRWLTTTERKCHDKCIEGNVCTYRRCNSPLRI